MNISRNWLEQYIDLTGISNEELSDIMTTIGLEVEGVEDIEIIKGGLRGIVVGNILTREKHPNADKLSVTTVDVGEAEALHIVCGAPNVAAGQKVLVATIGTTLYNGDEPWKIKKGKIRGEVSEGMICAEDELGLGSSHDGIMVLPEDTPIGKAASELYDTGSDTIFEIGLTPNRSDATCHLGVAKDICAYLKVHKDYKDDVKEPDINAWQLNKTTHSIKVDVLDTAACPRYSGITLDNVVIKDSPEWMQKYLKAVGVRPINNVVDITNYILHELGQPLHAFDYDKIAGAHVIVDKLAEGTLFTTLDEKERTLHSDDLMICDGNKEGLCIAGVFGGMTSGVTDDTTTVFLETAHFEASHIRKTSTRHLLRTDAAKVFEKGSDPNVTLYALKRAVLLLQEYAGAEIVSELIDIYPTKIEPVEIYITYDKINTIIGNTIQKEDVHHILRSMEMEIVPTGEEGFKVKVPTNKADVRRDVDIIEEILRIYGFNTIEIPSKVNSTLNYSSHPDKKAIKNRIASYLSAAGYNEMMGLSLIESKYYNEVLPVDDDELVFINNTSNIHLNIMRPEMLISGLISVLHNQNRQQTDLRLYEYGKSYRKKGSDFEEDEFLTVFITGSRYNESWLTKEKAEISYYDIKKTVHQVLGILGIEGYQVSEANDHRLDFGLSYTRGPQSIVSFGKVNHSIVSKMGIKSDVYYAEFPITTLVNSTRGAKKMIESISKYPTVRRDLAVVVDKAVSFGELEKIARSAGKKLIKDINLFDVYTHDEHVGKGKKSYAMSYIFENHEATLKDKEVDKVMQKMIHQYTEKLGAHIRS